MVDIHVNNEDLQLWIEDFLKKRKYSKYELEVSGSGAKGNGFLGLITFINVLAGIGRQHETTYNLVIKSIKKINEEKQLMAVRKAYAREMFMYLKVFPEFEKYQIRKGITTPFAKYPKCYSVYDNDGKEAIILENLRKLNYELHDSLKPQNLHHIFKVIKNYANYHALSVGLQIDDPELFKELTSNMGNIFGDFTGQKDLLDSIMKSFKHGMNLLEHDKAYQETYDKLKDIADNVNEFLENQHKRSDKLSVITHGDCWNNNMMFTYKGDDKSVPDDMVFLDFQMSALDSPIHDLAYYLYAVSDEHTLEDIDIIFEYYLYHLHNFLKMYNITNFYLTLDEFKDEWRTYSKQAIIIAPLILQIELMDDKKCLAEHAESNGLAEAFTTIENNNNEEFERRIKAIFKHFASLI